MTVADPDARSSEIRVSPEIADRWRLASGLRRAERRQWLAPPGLESPTTKERIMKTMLVACALDGDLPEVAGEGFRFAERLGLSPVLVHVDSNPGVFVEDAAFLDPARLERMRADYAELAARDLRDVAAAVAPGKTVEIVVRTGKASDELCELAKEREAELVVVGGGRRARLRHFLYGRTALGVVRRTHAAVLTTNVLRARQPVHHVLFATDLEEGSERAESWAARLGGLFGARVTVLHVSQLGSDKLLPYAMTKDELTAIRARLAASLEEVCARVERASSQYTPGSATVSAQLHFARDPATAIAEFAAEDHVDLVVVGTHGRKTLERVLLGSVAEGVLHKSKVSVLTVKPGGA